MDNWPNYKIYHLHELEKVLSDINKEEHPEEAQYIEKLIAQGGYRPPIETGSSLIGKEVSFRPKVFFVLLSFIVVGIIIALFGAVSSGAGHGPFPRLSILLMLAGALMAIISFIFLFLYSSYYLLRAISNKS